MNPVDIEAFLHDLADISGEAIIPFFRTTMGVDNKAGLTAFDPVTEADRAGEVAMRRLINQQFPAHGILGEEFGAENSAAEQIWVLDPIDGTRAFISGIPTWGTLIGLTHKGSPAMGMMSQPFTRERFWGDGAKARYRGPAGERVIRTRPCDGLANATVMCTTPAMFNGIDRERYDAVERATRLARYGSDCYAYCMLAAGHVDLVIEAGLKPYDIVALIPIIRGAGGIVTSWDGGSPDQGGHIIAAGSKKVHAQALKLLSGAG